MGSMSFRENFRHCSQEPGRLPTKQDTPHLSRQQVSQVSAQELTERVLILPYQGDSRFEFQLCCLRIPFVRQGVVCFHSVSLQVSWTFTVIVFKEIPLRSFMEEVSASFNVKPKPRIASGLHVFSSKSLAIAVQYLQGHPRSMTFRPSLFN